MYRLLCQKGVIHSRPPHLLVVGTARLILTFFLPLSPVGNYTETVEAFIDELKGTIAGLKGEGKSNFRDRVTQDTLRHFCPSLLIYWTSYFNIHPLLMYWG